MIPANMKEYLFMDTIMSKVITSDVQLEEYVCALLELDQESRLTAEEMNFAELLIALIEAYVMKYEINRSPCILDDREDFSRANDFWRNN